MRTTTIKTLGAAFTTWEPTPEHLGGNLNAGDWNGPTHCTQTSNTNVWSNYGKANPIAFH